MNHEIKCQHLQRLLDFYDDVHECQINGGGVLIIQWNQNIVNARNEYKQATAKINLMSISNVLYYQYMDLFLHVF